MSVMLNFFFYPWRHFKSLTCITETFQQKCDKLPLRSEKTFMHWKPACYMTLLAVIFKGRWRKELRLGTNQLVTILLVTLSPLRNSGSKAGSLNYFNVCYARMLPRDNAGVFTRTSCRNFSSSLSFHTCFSRSYKCAVESLLYTASMSVLWI